MTISVVLVTYNRVDLLERAINSIRSQSYKIDNIIVVNNASTDRTREYLESEIDIKSIHLDSNTGGAGGFHVGIRYACEIGTEYIWIMDDDAVAQENTLSTLVDDALFLEQHNCNWGFLCSQVVSEYNENMNVPTITRKLNSAGYPNWGEFGKNGLIGVDMATFVSMFTKVSIVKDVGLPVREMFIWGDDTEYTWRISKRYQCFISLNSQIYHKRVSGNALNIVTEENSDRLNWYLFYYRNNLYNRRKHGNFKDGVVYIFNSFKDSFLIIKASKNMKIKRLYTLWKGIFQGVIFNPQILFVRNKK